MRTLRNGLRALEQLASSDRPLGVTELGRRIGLPPSSTHRLLATLVDEGYAAAVPGTGRYEAGPAIGRLHARTLPPPLLREAAHPILMRIAEATGETAHLAVLDGTDVIAIDHVSGSAQSQARHPVGSRMPAHATALGMALLAFHPDAVDALVDSGLLRHTSETIADPGALRRHLAEVLVRGYATNIRGWHDDASGVAAPVVTSDGHVVAAVGISGSASVFARGAARSAVGSLVRRAGREIGHRVEMPGPAHPSQAS